MHSERKCHYVAAVTQARLYELSKSIAYFLCKTISKDGNNIHRMAVFVFYKAKRLRVREV